VTSPKKQYSVPLELTTPRIQGQRVKDCQWLLAGNNRFAGLATYKDGAIDGDYGPLTAQATYRTKYWLGYPDRDINRSFGQQLYQYLLKSDPIVKLPAEFASRRKQRLEAAEQSVGRKALEHAVTQIGTVESPFGSNVQKYGLWYGMNGVPWCAIFCSYCFGHTGTTRFRYSYVPAVHSDAQYCRNRLCVVRSPSPGDMACYTFGGVADAHIEFFERWIVQGSTFSAVGGNTGEGNDANGGAVMRRTRYVSNVNAFVRLT
jgi:hypothetical protein